MHYTGTKSSPKNLLLIKHKSVLKISLVRRYSYLQNGRGNCFYQSPIILTELFQHSLINVSYLTTCYLYQVMMTLHFLNDVANDAESTQK